PTFTLGDAFAQGHYSTVHHGKYKLMDVAIKIPTKESFYDNELLILKILIASGQPLSQNNIVGFHGTCQMPTHPGLVLDFANQGSMRTWFKNPSLPLNLDIKCLLLLDVSIAVTFIHELVLFMVISMLAMFCSILMEIEFMQV